MKDQELYSDLLAMQQRAVCAGHVLFARECYDFRMVLLDRHFRSIDPSYAKGVDYRMKHGIGWRP